MSPRNETLIALWSEAVAGMRARGLEPSPMLLADIEANIRGEMDVETIVERAIARERPAAPPEALVAALAARPLHALLYTSELAPGHDPSCVADITRVARLNNRRDGISGVLVFDGHRFAQWLEGPLDRLDDLLDRLRADPRHAGLRIQHRTPLPDGRLFAGWQLGYVLRDDEDEAVVHLQGLHGRVAVEAFDALLEGVDLM